ncbi:hypothetical protein LINPERHAP1_LOCUS16466 [Linum perenne]
MEKFLELLSSCAVPSLRISTFNRREKA